MKIYRNIDQGSADWFGIRMGIATASCFSQVMTPKTRKLSAQWKMYACRLIAERLTNQPTESVQGQEWMERGKALEPEAIGRFETVMDTETTPISFIKTDDGTMGCSPDRVIFGTDQDKPLKLVEVKCPSLPVWLNYQMFGRDADYECQLQGQMLIAEVDENIFYGYHPNAPKQIMLITHRNEAFIKDLQAALREFNDKLHEYHELAKSLGEWKAFQRVVTPTEIEEAANLNRQSDDPLADRIVKDGWGG